MPTSRCPGRMPVIPAQNPCFQPSPKWSLACHSTAVPEMTLRYLRLLCVAIAQACLAVGGVTLSTPTPSRILGHPVTLAATLTPPDTAPTVTFFDGAAI